MPLACHPRGDEIEGGDLDLLGILAGLNSLNPVPAMMVLEFQLPMPPSPRHRWRLMPRLRMPSLLLPQGPTRSAPTRRHPALPSPVRVTVSLTGDSS